MLARPWVLLANAGKNLAKNRFQQLRTSILHLVCAT